MTGPPILFGPRGEVLVLGDDGTATPKAVGMTATPADAKSLTDLKALHGLVLPLLYNGTDLDLARNNEEKTLLASALRSANIASSTQTNQNAPGLIWSLNITARTVGASPTIRVDFNFLDPIAAAGSTVYQTGNFDPTINMHIGIIHPGASGAATGKVSATAVEMLIAGTIPRRYSIGVSFVADVTDLTYSLAVIHIV